MDNESIMTRLKSKVEELQVEAKVAELQEAKAEEKKAKDKRVLVEAEVIELVKDAVKEEGASTHKAGRYKVVTTGKLSYSANIEDVENLDIPVNLMPIRTKKELDVKGVKYLKEHHPQVYAKIASLITVKPQKTAITIKELKEVETK